MQHDAPASMAALAQCVGEACLAQGEDHYTLRFEPLGGSVVASQKMMRLGVMRINAGLP